MVAEVGPRARLLKELERFNKEQRKAERDKNLKEGELVDTRSKCQKFQDKVCGLELIYPRESDMYTLTASYLEVQRVERA